MIEDKPKGPENEVVKPPSIVKALVFTALAEVLEHRIYTVLIIGLLIMLISIGIAIGKFLVLTGLIGLWLVIAALIYGAITSD